MSGGIRGRHQSENSLVWGGYIKKKHVQASAVGISRKTLPFGEVTLRNSLYYSIAPREPLLLQRLLDFVGSDGYSQRDSVGYAFIGAFALVYGLTAVFNAWYAHAVNKLAFELRSQLVDAIYRHVLELRVSALDSGQVTTLINVDIEHIMDGTRMVHELWASLITVAVAMYLLFLQLQLA